MIDNKRITRDKRNVVLTDEDFLILAGEFLKNTLNISQDDISVKVQDIARDWTHRTDNSVRLLKDSVNSYLDRILFATEVQEIANDVEEDIHHLKNVEHLDNEL